MLGPVGMRVRSREILFRASNILTRVSNSLPGQYRVLTNAKVTEMNPNTPNADVYNTSMNRFLFFLGQQDLYLENRAMLGLEIYY